MSLFETLKKAIFYNPMARTQASAPPSTHSSRPATPATSARPASATPGKSAPATAGKPAASAASPSPSADVPPPSSPATGQGALIDIEEVLEARSAQSQQKLNWRTSIVDLMKLVGLDSSLENRKALAAELGYAGDTSDSAAMNIWLHKAVMRKLAENGGKVPASLQ